MDLKRFNKEVERAAIGGNAVETELGRGVTGVGTSLGKAVFDNKDAL